MIWIARGLLAATVFAVPAAGAHERVAHRRALSAGMLVTITSAAHGPIGAGACGGTDLRVTNFPTANAIELMGFDETTSTTAPAGSGTFELQFPSICLASFIRALATNEVLTVNLAYLETVPSGNVNGTATMILALANARMTHVNIAWDVEGRVILAVGLASLNVTASTPGATPVASAGSGTSSAKPSGQCDIRRDRDWRGAITGACRESGRPCRGRARDSRPRAIGPSDGNAAHRFQDCELCRVGRLVALAERQRSFEADE